MKRVATLLLAFLLLSATPAWAKTIRVKFPRGRTTVVLKGRTTGGPSESGGMDPIAYQLRAKRGQEMTLHLTSAKGNAVLIVYAPGMELMEGVENGTDWRGTLPMTGDYEIVVYPEDEMTNTAFTLEISIR